MKRIIVKYILTLSLVFWVSLAFAGQTVHIVWPLEAGETHLQVQDQALDYAFNQAVMLEADDILGVKLEGPRREILTEFLAPKVKGLVLSYRELSRKDLPEELVLDLEVNVDRTRLKSFLKKIGVFYTKTKNWPYDLTLKSFNPEDWELLSRLQLLTGVAVQADSSPQLFLKRDLQGAWQGELKYNGQTISQTGTTLENVWMALWGKFFSLPEVQKDFMSRFVLATSGWATTDAIMFFDHVLGEWDKEIEMHKIVSVNMDVLAITSKWIVSTLDDAKLEQKLTEYLPKQGIVFELNKCE
ncbi:hypothetical protein [Desulfovulcanus sp.]